jgi:hypothetical protein
MLNARLIFRVQHGVDHGDVDQLGRRKTEYSFDRIADEDLDPVFVENGNGIRRVALC